MNTKTTNNAPVKPGIPLASERHPVARLLAGRKTTPIVEIARAVVAKSHNALLNKTSVYSYCGNGTLVLSDLERLKAQEIEFEHDPVDGPAIADELNGRIMYWRGDRKRAGHKREKRPERMVSEGHPVRRALMRMFSPDPYEDRVLKGALQVLESTPNRLLNRTSVFSVIDTGMRLQDGKQAHEWNFKGGEDASDWAQDLCDCLNDVIEEWDKRCEAREAKERDENG